MHIPRVPADWDKPLKTAVVCQTIGIVLGGLILDGGGILTLWLCVSVIFWIAAAVTVFLRKRPTEVERWLVGYGPLGLMLGLMCVASW